MMKAAWNSGEFANRVLNPSPLCALLSAEMGMSGIRWLLVGVVLTFARCGPCLAGPSGNDRIVILIGIDGFRPLCSVAVLIGLKDAAPNSRRNRFVFAQRSLRRLFGSYWNEPPWKRADCGDLGFGRRLSDVGSGDDGGKFDGMGADLGHRRVG